MCLLPAHLVPSLVSRLGSSDLCPPTYSSGLHKKYNAISTGEDERRNIYVVVVVVYYVTIVAIVE